MLKQHSSLFRHVLSSSSPSRKTLIQKINSTQSSSPSAMLVVFKNQEIVHTRNFSTSIIQNLLKNNGGSISSSINSTRSRKDEIIPILNMNSNTINVYPSSLKPRITSSSSYNYSTTVFSSATTGEEGEQELPGRKAVLIWLGTLSFLVFTIVIIGGLTRLEEGGLSMVDWSFMGSLPPITQKEWEEEFERYKQFPEYKKKNEGMTVEEFKYIFYYEYYHRMLGRLIGAVYTIPAIAFAAKGFFSGSRRVMSPWTVLAIGSVIGFQGLLGWYMVKSGLDENHELMKKYNSIPRVSQYRLASHLCTAFVIYAMTLWKSFDLATRNRAVENFAGSSIFKMVAPIFFSLVFLTAASGAFVAGMDAGLVYNEFPLMGGAVVPSDIMAIEPWYKNFFENATTVQFQHRWLATFVATAISVFCFFFKKGDRSKKLPATVNKSLTYLLHVVAAQYTLGITTLLTYVPTSVASAHQAGSLTLFTFALWMTHVARRIR